MIFWTALQWETGINSNYIYDRSTIGIAPAIAWLAVKLKKVAIYFDVDDVLVGVYNRSMCILSINVFHFMSVYLVWENIEEILLAIFIFVFMIIYRLRIARRKIFERNIVV